jgi:hypothetical protein
VGAKSTPLIDVIHYEKLPNPRRCNHMAPNDFAVETDYSNDKFFEQPRLVKLRAKDKRKARQEKRMEKKRA